MASGPSRSWGCGAGQGIPVGCFVGWGSGMVWVLRLVESGVEGSSGSVDVLEIERSGDLGDLANLGLSHAEGKQLVARVQQAVVAAQGREHAARRPACRICGAACRIKDYRPRRIATAFGAVTLRLPRFEC